MHYCTIKLVVDKRKPSFLFIAFREGEEWMYEEWSEGEK